MKRKLLQMSTAILLSASMLFETAVPVLGQEAAEENVVVVADEVAAVEDADEAVEEETLAVETVSGNTDTQKTQDKQKKEEQAKPAAPAEPKVEAAPTDVVVTQNKDGKTLLLSWKPVSGVDGYEVFSNTNDKGFTQLWTIEGGDKSSMDILATLDKKEINIASKYSFKIRAYIKKDGKMYYGPDSAEAKIAPKREGDEWLLESVGHNYKSVILSWKPAGGVSGYKILMATKKEGPYKVLKSVNEPGQLVDKDLNKKALSLSKTYYIKVQAFVKDNGKEYLSEPSSAIAAKPALEAPVLLNIAATSKSYVNLKWTKCEGASGYEVYRSKKESKNGNVIAGGKKKTKLNTSTKKLKKTKYTDKTGAIGVKYYYRIRAYKTINGKRYYSEYSPAWASKTKLYATKIVAKKSGCVNPDKVVVSWKKVSRAKGYFVQRSTKKKKGFKTVYTVTDGKTTSAEIDQANGTKYYYRVIAFNKKKSKKTWSSASMPVRLTSDFYCYPQENYQQRCQRVFGQNSYQRYGSAAAADEKMADVGYTLWKQDAKKAYTQSANATFKVNRAVQPTVDAIIKKIQEQQVNNAKLKIIEVSGYNFGSYYQEDREGVAVRVKVEKGTPGTAEYNAVAAIMASYGFNRLSPYSQAYDPDRYVYVGMH